MWKHRKIQLCSCGCGKSLGNLNHQGTTITRIKIGKETFIECHEKRGFNGYAKYIEEKKEERLKKYKSGHSMPSIKEIVKYNEDLIKEGKFKVTIKNAHGCCWACGRKSYTERCHIIARRHNGGNHPKNIWLLCSGCHRIQPDASFINDQLQWVKDMPKINENSSSNDYTDAMIISLSLRWDLPTDHPCIVEIISIWYKLQLEQLFTTRNKQEKSAYERI